MRKLLAIPDGVILSLFPPGNLLNGRRSANEAWIRGLCSVAYLGNDTALCRSLGRFKMVVDTTDFGLAPHIMLDGYWEMWVTEVVARLVRPGMVVADIGANLGYFTLLMAELVGSAGRVHAFEPNPRMAELLQRSLDINGLLGHTDLHQLALGDVDGASLELVVPANEPKNAHLQPLGDAPSPGSHVVQMVRLDSRPDWCQIELAKIDVEGSEELVWAGAQGLLDGDRLRTIILEFTPDRYASAAVFLKRMLDAGFALARIDPWAGTVGCSAEELLDGDGREDRMLLLTR